METLTSRRQSLRKDNQGNSTRLLIACIKPFKPVSSTIAWWLKTVLEEAGIDTSIFKAHSTRSASVSAAAAYGVTTNDILQAADWSCDSVLQRFYYKPIINDNYGSKQIATNLTIDMWDQEPINQGPCNFHVLPLLEVLPDSSVGTALFVASLKCQIPNKGIKDGYLQ